MKPIVEQFVQDRAETAASCRRRMPPEHVSGRFIEVTFAAAIFNRRITAEPDLRDSMPRELIWLHEFIQRV